MRNVVKGYEVSHLAVPKMHQNGINKLYNRMHGPRTSQKFLKNPKRLKMPKMPGHNPGID